MSTVNPVSVPPRRRPKTAKTSNQDAFGKDAFMKLLVEQMRHQSPTDPSDGQQWINQMTQFSMLEQMQQQSAGQVKANAAALPGQDRHLARRQGTVRPGPRRAGRLHPAPSPP